jgi:hypothetical protein
LKSGSQDLHKNKKPDATLSPLLVIVPNSLLSWLELKACWAHDRCSVECSPVLGIHTVGPRISLWRDLQVNGTTMQFHLHEGHLDGVRDPGSQQAVLVAQKGREEARTLMLQGLSFCWNPLSP